MQIDLNKLPEGKYVVIAEGDDILNKQINNKCKQSIDKVLTNPDAAYAIFIHKWKDSCLSVLAGDSGWKDYVVHQIMDGATQLWFDKSTNEFYDSELLSTKPKLNFTFYRY